MRSMHSGLLIDLTRDAVSLILLCASVSLW